MTENETDKGTWYCPECKTPVEIIKREEKDGVYIIISSCPNAHKAILKPDDGGLIYLTRQGQKDLAKAFLIYQLDDLGRQEKIEDQDIMVPNIEDAMVKVSGLSIIECTDIIKQGIEEGWVVETQKLILGRIAKGKEALNTEFKIN